MRSGSSKGGAKSRKKRKTNKKVCGAPWGMRQKEIEKSKSGRRCREKRNANERRRKRQARAAMRGSETKAAERRRGAIVSRGAATGKGSQGRKKQTHRRKHAMTQCINMHKRAKTSINVEVLADDKTYVPHETRTQRNALPCTACGNRGSRKRQDGASNGSVSGKSGRVWAFAAKLRICLAQSVRNEDGGRMAVRVGWQSGCR